MPWDNAMREDFCKKREDGKAYKEWLVHHKPILIELEEECQNLGLTLEQLPSLICGKQSSLMKILDEYNLVTITKKHKVSAETIDNWYEWATQNKILLPHSK